MPTPEPIDKKQSNDSIELFYKVDHPLSNVYPCKIKIDSKIYESAEHVYQAFKFNLDTDSEIIELIESTPSPTDAKMIANNYKHRMDPNWDQKKLRLMINIVYQKMIQNPDIAELLINTSNKYLIEDSPNDPSWGMTTNSDELLEGSNYLGRILMIVRKKLLKEL